MSDIFLSYSRDDQATALRFAEAFGREGMSVWWDQSLNPGESYDRVTEKALADAKAVVVLWSKKSVDSHWVRAEATQAHANGTLVPAMIEACKRPIMFELTHTADLAHWRGDPHDRAWQSYMAGVRRFVEKESSATTPTASTAGQMKRIPRQKMVMACVAALLLAGAAVWALNSSRGEPAAVAAPAAPVPATRPAATGAVTLAVLPFADMSPAHDHEYFSDGLTEELLNQLAQIKALRVTARTSSFSFKGRNEDTRDIGQKLGVGNILEGSVRKDGNQLRITAQLIDTRDGAHVWSKTYDRELSGVFALQEEVAKDVAKALSIALDVGALPRVQGGTTNVEAYDSYLQGRELFLQGGRPQAVQAAERLREAVRLDPQFSRAWLLLAHALGETTVGVPRADSAPIRAEAAAARIRVMELAPNAWWAQSMRANELLGQRKWAEAEAAMDAALNSAETNSVVDLVDGRSSLLTTLGRVREALPILQQERDRNPLSLAASTELQMNLDAAGQPVQAQEEYLRSKGLAGTHQRADIFALLRLLNREDAKPSAIREQFRVLLGNERLPMPLAHSLAETFESPARTREAIRMAIDDPANQDFVRMTVVALYADAFNERDLALIALRRAVLDFHSDTALWFAWRPGLRADPRFKDILREVGLVDYFRASGNWGDFCKPVGQDDFECR